jgi:hypothetical protein
VICGLFTARFSRQPAKKVVKETLDIASICVAHAGAGKPRADASSLFDARIFDKARQQA